jgi:hypothetical protein
VAFDRSKSVSVSRDEQVVVPGELDERVAPIEQDGLDQRVARLATW